MLGGKLFPQKRRVSAAQRLQESRGDCIVAKLHEHYSPWVNVAHNKKLIRSRMKPLEGMKMDPFGPQTARLHV